MSSTRRASRDHLARNAYMDVLGRTWSTEKLDSLLAMPEVQRTVDEAHQRSLTPRGTLRPGTCYVWCKGQYEREAPAALLHLLVVRRHDLGAQP